MQQNNTDLFRLEEINGRYIVKNHLGNVIRTHGDTEFPPLSLELANLLIADFQISPYFKDKLNYRSCFVYCLLSTLFLFNKEFSCPDPDCQIDHFSININVAHDIQWDRALRLSPDPHQMMAQRVSIAPLVNFLDSDYKDYPANYASTIEEMNDPGYGTEFISDEIINKFQDLLNHFNRAQRFTVVFINNQFNNFSLCLTSLLIAGKMSPKEYFSAAIVFLKDKKSTDLSKDDRANLKDFLSRIANLFTILKSDLLKEYL